MSAVLPSNSPLLGLVAWPSANHRAMLSRSYLNERLCDASRENPLEREDGVRD